MAESNRRRLPLDVRIKRLVKVVQCSEYVNTPCWVWQGSCSRDGYPKMSFKVLVKGARRHVKLYAHRLAYELWKGPIPKGSVVDHVCVIERCVNPDHLRLLSHEYNSGKRRSSKGRR